MFLEVETFNGGEYRCESVYDTNQLKKQELQPNKTMETWNLCFQMYMEFEAADNEAPCYILP